MSVQCILNRRVPSVKMSRKNVHFSRAVQRASIIEARKNFVSSFREMFTEGPRLPDDARNTPGQALCQRYVFSAWNTKRRLLPTSARLGRPASTSVFVVRRGRPQWWHTRRAVPASRRRSQPPPYTRASHPFPESSQSAHASHRPSHRRGGTTPELRFSTFLSPGG